MGGEEAKSTTAPPHTPTLRPSAHTTMAAVFFDVGAHGAGVSSARMPGGVFSPSLMPTLLSVQGYYTASADPSDVGNVTLTLNVRS